MEEILASIKRIIADDGLALNGTRPRPRADATEAPPADTVLELTEPVAPSPAPVAAAAPVLAAAPPAAVPEPQSPAQATAVETGAPSPATQFVASAAADAPAASETPPLVSENAACASRQALSNLSSMVLRTPGVDNTLDGLVRELLRPMLKEWLDARLPDLVETLVAREIARITGKAL